MKILLTGANGFIGAHWIEKLALRGHTVLATGIGPSRLSLADPHRYQSLDITDKYLVDALIDSERPDAILHAAALSKPDRCEADQALALRVNLDATEHLLDAAARHACYFCFISTDFVFDGVKGMYREMDPPAPINFYGVTKWRAEQAVQRYPHAWSIVRTVSVYGPPVPGRPNLLSTVIEKLSAGEEYAVFEDQIRTPTYAGDLAEGVAELIQRKMKGIFHLCGEEVLTPYQMAVRVARHMGLDPTGIRPTTANQLTQPARRPAITGLQIDKAKKSIGFRPVSFEEGLHLSFPLR